MDDTIEKHPGGAGTFFIRRPPKGDTESVDHGIVFDGPTADLTLRDPLEQVIATLKPYAIVISDRLHGGIIALMMRKKVVFLPVGYHKTRSFFDTWLAAMPGAVFVNTQSDLHPSMIDLQTPACNLKALFCKHADPAFSRFLMNA